ncbi:L,D-transpeptidase family protein [Streptomyces clavuligerus]|nr:L,D-transpeptidase family protein [Streptomyces clavuligerus]ANW18507.1 peptidoglycan-binding protein [Streptomyces clavuligerus]AXU13064.1 murein L,D-transpeptidase [Streptomyces clavuligerus]MBY6303000.1 peptidoglycan-binding protein [Streptomyces clavuligerus]QCS05847.1 murein L,D-transpeptidase [Streptomyces clavuligerus]QPJ94789.1 L,D-transpeptidase family protein [Streptomyces clavuligerus]
MSGAGVRRSVAALAVLTAVTGCTAEAADRPASAHGDGDTGGGAPTAERVPGPRKSTDTAHSPAVRPERRAADAQRTRTTPKEQQAQKARTQRAPERPARSTDTIPAAGQATVVMSRGAQGPRVRELQARLAQIGWFGSAPTGFYGRLTADAVRGFQGKRGLSVTGLTDTTTWRKLRGMTTAPTAEELSGTRKDPVKAAHKPRPRLDPRCLNGRVLCISKTTRSLSWVVDGTVRSTMDVRFGAEYTPTREGVFSVFWKSRHHVSTLYDTPMPYAMFFSGGQAVHYSADFAAQGYNGASHGCVNVRNRSAVAALFAEVRTGDKVVVHW